MLRHAEYFGRRLCCGENARNTEASRCARKRMHSFTRLTLLSRLVEDNWDGSRTFVIPRRLLTSVWGCLTCFPRQSSSLQYTRTNTQYSLGHRNASAQQQPTVAQAQCTDIIQKMLRVSGLHRCESWANMFHAVVSACCMAWKALGRESEGCSNFGDLSARQSGQ